MSRVALTHPVDIFSEYNLYLSISKISLFAFENVQHERKVSSCERSSMMSVWVTYLSQRKHQQLYLSDVSHLAIGCPIPTIWSFIHNLYLTKIHEFCTDYI